MNLFKKVKEFCEYGTKGRDSSQKAFEAGIKCGIELSKFVRENDKKQPVAKKSSAVKAKAPAKKIAAKKVVKKATAKACAK